MQSCSFVKEDGCRHGNGWICIDPFVIARILEREKAFVF